MQPYQISICLILHFNTISIQVEFNTKLEIICDLPDNESRKLPQMLYL